MIVEKLSNKYEKETNSVLYLGEDTGQDVVVFSPRALGCIIQTQRRGKGMKRAGILNSDISRVLSYLGHTDQICIGDCGLPIPDETERIDLALAFGEPTFMRTLELVAADMKIEKIILAEEIKTQNPQVLKQIEELFAGQNVETEFVSHVELKEQTKSCKAVIRTGEITPYANIILQSGCIFA